MITKAEQSDSGLCCSVRAEAARCTAMPGCKHLGCHPTYCIPATCSWGLFWVCLHRQTCYPLLPITPCSFPLPPSLVASWQESSSPKIPLFETYPYQKRKEKKKKKKALPSPRVHYSFQNRNASKFGKMTVPRLKVTAIFYY